MVCGSTARNGLPFSRSSTPPASFELWICAEMANSTMLSRIHPSAAIPTHLRTRRHVGFGAPGSFGSLGPVSFGFFEEPVSRSRSPETSGGCQPEKRPRRDL